MTLRCAPLLACVALLMLAVGCEPKCREVEPLSAVRERLRERTDDRLDEIDASDAQRAKLHALLETTIPALARVREETQPRERAVIAELRRDEPDRAKLQQLIELNLNAGEQYLRALVDAMYQGHGVLSAEQRKALAERAAEPSEPFESSFLLDRAVDYFMSRIDATAEQRRLVERLKRLLITRGRALQRKADSVRAEVARELAQDEPQMPKVYAALTRGRSVTRDALFELVGAYLLLASKLDERQRGLMNAELVRFEPCMSEGAEGK